MIKSPIRPLALLIPFILSGCQALQTAEQQEISRQTIEPPAQHQNTEEPSAEENTAKTESNTLATSNSNRANKNTSEKEVVQKDLWQLTRENFKLDLDQQNPRLKAQFRWYSRHPQYMNRVVDRASRYYYHIIHEVIKRDMPAELALLPIVESAYDPFAYSHGRASGPWQFIPGTGKRFGLKQTWWYDGRRDIVASTRAALDYLDILQKRYNGDWELALAAYNAGEGNVDKAVKRNKKAGKPIDFWSLKLPKETSAYVPKLLAVAKLFAEPEKYGFKPNRIENTPYFKTVDIKGQLDLSEAAKLADIDMEELYLLNPGFNRWATDPNGPHYLVVPVDKADQFAKKIASLPIEKRMSWDRYMVRSGDTLSQIAKRFDTSVSVIKTSNRLKSNRLKVNQALLIPKASNSENTYVLSQSQRQLKSERRIARSTSKKKTTYTVKSGDNFWSIAKKHGVKVRSLASWNGLATRDILSIGQKLVIWNTPKADSGLKTASRKGTSATDALVRKIGYRVRSGDSLYAIASRFKISVKDIKRWNKLNEKYLQPGQKLTLYVDIRR